MDLTSPIAQIYIGMVVTLIQIGQHSIKNPASIEKERQVLTHLKLVVDTAIATLPPPALPALPGASQG